MIYLHIDMLSFLFMGWTLKCFSVHQFAFKFCLWSFTSLSLNWRQLNIYLFLLYHMDFRSRLEWFSPFWNVKRKIYIILILLLFIINLCIIWNLYLGYVWIIYPLPYTDTASPTIWTPPNQRTCIIIHVLNTITSQLPRVWCLH